MRESVTFFLSTSLIQSRSSSMCLKNPPSGLILYIPVVCLCRDVNSVCFFFPTISPLDMFLSRSFSVSLSLSLFYHSFIQFSSCFSENCESNPSCRVARPFSMLPAYQHTFLPLLYSFSPYSLYLCVYITTVSPFLQFQGGYGRKKKKKEVRRYVTLSNTLSISSDFYLTNTYTCTHAHTSPTPTTYIRAYTCTLYEYTRTRSHDFSSLGSTWPID